ncbi:hypothetical protein [Aquicoccus sp. SU-CL01552]|uniref:hypothetical protein n=1 Tax=Aquicoccus sp. SU-CL01552 TaxID=3127656 RepID=UPI0031024991
MTRKIVSHRSFITLISGLALVVAITGATAAPARADNDDAARFFAGLVGLAILGAAIEGSRNDHGTVVHQRKVVVQQPPRHVYHPQRTYKPQYHAPRVQQPPRAHQPHVQRAPQRQVKVIRKKVVNKRVVHVHR